MRPRTVSALAVALSLGAWAPAFAAGDPDDSGAAPAHPEVRSTLLAAGESPRIDGALDDPAWRRAGRTGGFVQVAPVDGAPATQATEVLVAHDADFLYIGLVCHDDPREVRARQMDRDAFVRYDDVVELWLDTFHDARSAFWFQITPAGSRGDALIADGGSSFNKQWDGIWYGRARVTERGWEAELALPFRTLAFDPGGAAFGFNLRRRRVASGEETRWAATTVAYSFFALTEGGTLVGLDGARQGHGVDVAAYTKAAAGRADSGAASELDADVGVDVTWRPTPASALRMTVNTDFAETEVDDRQVNLERFPLFFPEKRGFFLEDAGVFEFGAPMLRETLIPFFSRRVGRSGSGEAVPILGGAKFTGRFEDVTVGALGTALDGFDGVEGQNLGVVRVAQNLGEGRTVGGLVTTGDPLDGSAATFGLDARLGSPRFFGAGHAGYLWAYALGTTGDDVADEGRAFGAQAQAQSSSFRHDVQVQRVEADFAPALGFVRRTGIDSARFESRYTWRSGDSASWIRTTSARVAPTFVRDRVGEEDLFALPIQLFDTVFASDDRLELEVHHIDETLDEPFAVGGDAVAPAGEYAMRRWFLEFESNDRRKVAGLAGLEHGDYYGGTLRRVRLEPLWLPNRYATFGLVFADIDVALDSGDFHTQLYGWRVGLTFSPDLAWRTLVQYDTDSKELDVQSRLHWIVEPGQDLFVVVSSGFSKFDHDASFVSEAQQAIVKLAYTWRF